MTPKYNIDKGILGKLPIANIESRNIMKRANKAINSFMILFLFKL